MTVRRAILKGLRRLLAIVLLCVFLPVGMGLLLLPLVFLLLLPDLVIRALDLLGASNGSGFFHTSGPVGVIIGACAAHWHRSPKRVIDMIVFAPLQRAEDIFDAIYDD